jgi:hypothetical protein
VHERVRVFVVVVVGVVVVGVVVAAVVACVIDRSLESTRIHTLSLLGLLRRGCVYMCV